MTQFARALSMACLFAITVSVDAGAQPAPPSTVIEYSTSGPSAWTDVPSGAYRVPNSSIIVLGHHGASPLGLLFGPAGFAVQGAINTQISKEAAGTNEDFLSGDIAQEASDLTRHILASGGYGQRFALNAEAGAATASVTPYVVITFVSDAAVRPTVILKATLKPAGAGEPPRTTQYLCCVGQPLPLDGDNGLRANGGQPLKSVLANELETAINVMLHDLEGAYTRDKMVTVHGVFPFQTIKLFLRGYDLAEDEGTLVFSPKGSMLYSSPFVWVMDKSSISYESK